MRTARAALAGLWNNWPQGRFASHLRSVLVTIIIKIERTSLAVLQQTLTLTPDLQTKRRKMARPGNGFLHGMLFARITSMSLAFWLDALSFLVRPSSGSVALLDCLVYNPSSHRPFLMAFTGFHRLLAARASLFLAPCICWRPKRIGIHLLSAFSAGISDFGISSVHGASHSAVPLGQPMAIQEHSFNLAVRRFGEAGLS